MLASGHALGVGVGSVLRLPRAQCAWRWMESQVGTQGAKRSPGGHLGSADKFFPFFKL